MSTDDRRYTAAVEGMSNWERSQWARAGYPGAVNDDADRVGEFIAGLPARGERRRYTLTSFGRVPLVDVLRGRTGIVVLEFGDQSAVVEGTARMIERLVDRFNALDAELHEA